jgi:hypothetical protein
MRTLASISAAAACLWILPAFAQEAAKPVATAASPTATASPVSPPAPVKFGHEMGGHFFLPSHIIEDPFSETTFGMSFGLGSGNALGPELQLQPPEILEGSKWYGYTGIGVGLAMNVRFLEYLSARAVVATTAYLGTGSGAVLTVGSSARVTGDVGVKGSLPVESTSASPPRSTSATARSTASSSPRGSWTPSTHAGPTRPPARSTSARSSSSRTR